MAKLKSYPESINNVTLPNEPDSWTTRRDVVENVGTTEAGTDVVDIMRVGKLTITASYNVSSNWLVQFEAWADETSPLSVKLYDPATSAYIIKDMRMRNFTSDYVKYSKNTSGTLGLYVVSFDLIEF
jgi:hypothetical protein